MLNVVTLSVVRLNVVAPLEIDQMDDVRVTHFLTKLYRKRENKILKGIKEKRR
jgi:hypothetical protein